MVWSSLYYKLILQIQLSIHYGCGKGKQYPGQQNGPYSKACHYDSACSGTVEFLNHIPPRLVILTCQMYQEKQGITADPIYNPKQRHYRFETGKGYYAC